MRELSRSSQAQRLTIRGALLTDAALQSEVNKLHQFLFEMNIPAGALIPLHDFAYVNLTRVLHAASQAAKETPTAGEAYAFMTETGEAFQADQSSGVAEVRSDCVRGAVERFLRQLASAQPSPRSRW